MAKVVLLGMRLSAQPRTLKDFTLPRPLETRTCRGRSPLQNARQQRLICASTGKGFGKDLNDADALISSMDELSKAQGRVPKTTNMVLGTEGMDWDDMDAKVNEYPLQRDFKAIGKGGDEFVQDMTQLVAGVLGRQIPPELIYTRPSSKGTYLSVTMGPVLVKSPEELKAVYTALQSDSRVKWVI
ncbi:hypothetical protein CYMTET_45521 [Cymbomonas tetramitiformis]|uniref:Uncharacterized protein n=1 Tax=Cymbomonas tetramitiformis TaxID=36881 RepID=A0AAE0BZU6_9CHLO|nr:hypothetical protein CYMTET_45521 [Cymbomonas tetramitiformis]